MRSGNDNRRGKSRCKVIFCLEIHQLTTKLKSKIIDPSKCVPRTLLYHQISRNAQSTIDNQNRKFNLGNGQISRNAQSTIDNQNRKFNLGNGQLLNDPILAADQLLLREYSDSALFDANRYDPVFIPPVLQSNQYTKKDSNSIEFLSNFQVSVSSLESFYSPVQLLSCAISLFFSSGYFRQTLDLLSLATV
eukprot:TCONS_00048743-protein